MKSIFLFAVMLAFTVNVLISCKQTVQPRTETNETGLQALKDSLRVLDSLVVISKFNNRIRALQYARQALNIARASGDTSCSILALNTMGIAFDQYNVDSSYSYYSSAQKLAEKTGALRRYPQIIYNIAFLYYQAYDYKTALTLLDSVVNVSRSREKWEILASAYNLLGNVKAALGLTSESLDAYHQAEELSERKNLVRELGISLTNQAPYETNSEKAMALNRRAIHYLSLIPGNEHAIASILVNMGNLMQIPDSALRYYQDALDIETKFGFTDLFITTCNNLACSYLEKGDVQMAEGLIKDKALPLALADTNLSDLALLYDTYADICKGRGQYEQALGFQKLATDFQLRADAKIAGDQARLLSALLEAKNRELLISNQQMEIRLQSGLNEQYRTYMILLALFLLLLMLSFVWYRQRSHLKMQKERLHSAQRIIDAGENEQKQVGRELHDIATQLSMGLQITVDDSAFSNEEDRLRLSGEIETVRTIIRDLSHRMHAGTLAGQGLQPLLTRLFKDIKTKGVIHLDDSVGPELPEFSAQVVLHSYRIVQELLTNAMRHAPGSEVECEIYYAGNLYINYTDNGPGFDTGRAANSMGLTNIKDRLTLLGGTSSLVSSPGNGTSWEIVIPALPATVQTDQPS